MCGIVGIAGDLFYKEEKTMQSLLLLDYFRGTDSTGLAAVRNNGDVKVAKWACDPITLFQYGKFKEALNGNTSKLFLGHNRATTSGATNPLNAHPFEFGHITGVQNGTLEYRDKFELEEAVGEKFDVDSQALFAAIAKLGIKDTIEMCTEGSDSARGAWSLVWYDKKEDTLNFLRNKWRPMWLAWDENFKRLFFASRYEMIRHACEMADTTYKLERHEYKDKPGEEYTFFHVPDNHHWKFNLDEMRKGSKSRPKPIQKIIQGKEPPKSGSKKPFSWDPFPGLANHQGNKTPSSTTTSHLGTNQQGDGVINLNATLAEPYAGVVDRQKFNFLAQANPTGQGAGCVYCYKPIVFGEPGVVVYEEQDVILCAGCAGTKEKSLMAARIHVRTDRFLQIHNQMKKAA